MCGGEALLGIMYFYRSTIHPFADLTRVLAKLSYQSKSSPPRLWAGRSVPWPGRERQLPSPPAAPRTAYSAAR